MIRISPLIKGVITGSLMVLFSLYFIITNQPPALWAQVFPYVLYAGGIAWTLIDYSRSGKYTEKFKDIFGQGFRCFIIVTLVMVLFTIVYLALHPELAAKEEEAMRTQINKLKGKTADDLDKKLIALQLQKDSFNKVSTNVPVAIDSMIEETEYLKRLYPKIKDKTPAEIETALNEGRKQYTIINVSGSIFGYLIPGAIFTLAGAGLLLIRRR